MFFILSNKYRCPGLKGGGGLKDYTTMFTTQQFDNEAELS